MLRDLFRRSFDAFRAELERRDPEDQVAELLIGMRRELVAAKATLPELAESIARLGQERERERRLLDDCERRGTLAGRIGDDETVRVAAEFAEQHRARLTVIEQKLSAAEAERALRSREVEQMTAAYRKAEANRFALLARLRTQQAKSRIHGESQALWDELERMEDEVERGGRYADALEELDGAEPPRQAPRAPSVDERLAELKRRMGSRPDA